MKYDAFLLNGRGADDPWTLAVRPGERVRLRLINGGASTYFRIRLDGHPLQITHADGLAVEPVTVDHLLMGMGETYDAVVTIAAPGSYTLHAVAQDGSGQALGVLHTADVARAAQPRDAELRRARADLRRPARRGADDAARRAGADASPAAAGRHGALRLDDRRAGVAEGRSAAHPPRRAGADRDGQPDDDVAPDAPARPLLPPPAGRRRAHARSSTPSTSRRSETVRIEFTADNPGNWFFHCHNVYHLEAGMARVFEYVA